MGRQWAAAPSARLRGADGRLCEALVSGHDGLGLVGRAGRDGLGGAFPPGGWFPRPQATSRHGGMPRLDQGAHLAHLSDPTGRADTPAMAPSTLEPGLGAWKLVAHAGMESPEVSCLDPRPPSAVLAVPCGICAILACTGEVGKYPCDRWPVPLSGRESRLKSWKLLLMGKRCYHSFMTPLPKYLT
jgi:hypothetical protein